MATRGLNSSLMRHFDIVPNVKEVLIRNYVSPPRSCFTIGLHAQAGYHPFGWYLGPSHTEWRNAAERVSVPTPGACSLADLSALGIFCVCSSSVSALAAESRGG